MSFQSRVRDWLLRCFGRESTYDKVERNHRFLEEALELVQSCDCTKEEALRAVDYVFDQPKGVPYQEVGGVMNTLAGLCLANRIEMGEAAEAELARCWRNSDKIRARRAAKPEFSTADKT